MTAPAMAPVLEPPSSLLVWLAVSALFVMPDVAEVGADEVVVEDRLALEVVGRADVELVDVRDVVRGVVEEVLDEVEEGVKTRDGAAAVLVVVSAVVRPPPRPRDSDAEDSEVVRGTLPRVVVAAVAVSSSSGSTVGSGCRPPTCVTASQRGWRLVEHRRTYL